MGVTLHQVNNNDATNFTADLFEGTGKLFFISSPVYDDALRIKQHATVVVAARDAGLKHIIYTVLGFPNTHQTTIENVHLATELAIAA